MDSLQVLREVDRSLSQAMARGLGREGLQFSLDPTATEQPEIGAICARLERAFGMISDAYRYAESLANGELQMQVSRDNAFAMPLKALHASLRHLTWQANEVAAGDLNQTVQFLGEFSRSFNHMIGALREKAALEQRLRIIAEVLGEGVCLLDADGRVVFMNPEGEALLGYRLEELAGKPWSQFVHRQHLDGTCFTPDASPLVAAIRSGQEHKDDDAVFTCKSGLLMPVSLTCRPVISDGVSAGAVIAFRDITEQKQYQESLKTINDLLERQATTDPLTGIYNRLKLSRLLTFEIELAGRCHTPLSLVLFDFDNFKSINDTYGHVQGDAVLQDVAQLVAADMRRTEVFARWGGEEFMILAPGCDQCGALQLAEKLRAKLERTRFSVPVPVTCSFGVSTFRTDDTDISLIRRADEALYCAKQNGRNCVAQR